MSLGAAMSTTLENRFRLLRQNVGRLVRRFKARMNGRADKVDEWRRAGGRVIVIAPHPDDEVIGCGGTIMRHVDAGDPVTVVWLTRGGNSVGYEWLGHDERADVREQEARESSRLLGVEELIFVDGVDGGMARPDVMERIGRRMDEMFREKLPKVVYVPHASDDHPDHVAAYRLVQRAVQAMPEGEHPTVYQYEVWSPMHADFAVDISRQMRTKLKAIKCHRLALNAFNYVATLEALARYRSGTMLRRDGYAEAFKRDTNGVAGA